MLSNFHKSCILTGCIDYLCLACENVLRSEEDVNTHIEKPVHKKNLANTRYVESCTGEGIRKVKKGYYCEHCNIVITTITKVNLHINEEDHIFNKTDDNYKESKTQHMKWVCNAVIVFDDILIQEKAWSGMVDDTCIVCDTEVDNWDLHKSEFGHNLKLVLSKVQIGFDNTISRKIDDSTFQCLTCNSVVPSNAMVAHFESSLHRKQYVECRKAKREHTSQIKEPCKETAANDIQENKNGTLKKNNTKEKAKDTHVKSVDIKSSNKENIPAKNVPASMNDNIPANSNEVQIVMKKPKLPAKSLIPTPENVDDALGTKEYMLFTGNCIKLQCLLCEQTVDWINMNQHISGRHHQKLLELTKSRTAKMNVEYGIDNKATGIVVKDNKIQNATKNNKPIKQDKKCVDKNVNKNLKGEENRAKIIDATIEFEKQNVKIDFTLDSAYCKKCLKELEFTFENISEHIKNHKIEQQNKVNSMNELESKQKQKGDVDIYAKANNITLNNDKAYCRICGINVSSSYIKMQKHVESAEHKNKTKPEARIKPTKKQYETVLLSEFIESGASAKNIFRQDAIINDKFCISLDSYMIVTSNDNGARCQVCETNLLPDEIRAHMAGLNHRDALGNIPVIVSLHEEFVREVRPEVYHCSYCNTIDAGWDNLQDHFRSTIHRQNRTSAEWSLAEYLPKIQASREEEERTAKLTVALALLGLMK